MGILWIDPPEDIHVGVTDGQVILSGTVASSADTETAPLPAERKP